MKKTFTISGTAHLIGILKQYPQISALSSMAGMANVARQAQDAAKKAGCNCQANKIFKANDAVFQQALNSMGNGDHLIIKNVLNMDEICYYTNNNNQRILKCI